MLWRLLGVHGAEYGPMSPADALAHAEGVGDGGFEAMLKVSGLVVEEMGAVTPGELCRLGLGSTPSVASAIAG